jgi:hypothetical protein
MFPSFENLVCNVLTAIRGGPLWRVSSLEFPGFAEPVAEPRIAIPVPLAVRGEPVGVLRKLGLAINALDGRYLPMLGGRERALLCFRFRICFRICFRFRRAGTVLVRCLHGARHYPVSVGVHRFRLADVAMLVLFERNYLNQAHIPGLVPDYQAIGD